MRLGCLSHMTLRIKNKVSSVSGSLLCNHPLCPPLTSARDQVHRLWRAAGFAAPDRASSRLSGAAGGQREASAQTSRLSSTAGEDRRLTGGTSPAPPCGQRHTLHPPLGLVQSPATGSTGRLSSRCPNNPSRSSPTRRAHPDLSLQQNG